MIDTVAEHLHEMIAAGQVSPLPITVSVEFHNFLESQPLRPPLQDAVDWSRVPHSAIAWYDKTDDELIEWARSLRLGRSSHVAMWYSADEPALLAEFAFGVANLDTLTWKAPGPRYLFGVTPGDNGDRYDFAAFLEVTGGRLLHATV